MSWETEKQQSEERRAIPDRTATASFQTMINLYVTGQLFSYRKYAVLCSYSMSKIKTGKLKLLGQHPPAKSVRNRTAGWIFWFCARKYLLHVVLSLGESITILVDYKNGWIYVIVLLQDFASFTLDFLCWDKSFSSKLPYALCPGANTQTSVST